MKILVTNDDGVESPGLWAVADALKGVADIFVVAPDREQSGVGTSLTLHVPIRAKEITPLVEKGDRDIKAYAVEGTPGDCCVLGLERLVGPVDLVVSGINQGSNVGEDVLVSGTVGAAMQAHLRGYPSVAISVAAVKNTCFDVAAAFLHSLGEKLAGGVVLPSSLLNVNIPNEPMDKIKGVQVTCLGGRSYGENIKDGNDGRRSYYWITRNKPLNPAQREDTDNAVLRAGCISITPLFVGLTDLKNFQQVEAIFNGHLDGDLNPEKTISGGVE